MTRMKKFFICVCAACLLIGVSDLFGMRRNKKREKQMQEMRLIDLHAQFLHDCINWPDLEAYEELLEALSVKQAIHNNPAYAKKRLGWHEVDRVMQCIKEKKRECRKRRDAWLISQSRWTANDIREKICEMEERTSTFQRSKYDTRKSSERLQAIQNHEDCKKKELQILALSLL